jgi:hypothetical protein
VGVGVIARQAPSPDVNKILADARDALGGDKKIAAIKSLTASGRSTRLTTNGATPNDFDMAMELPDKYVKKETLAMINGSAIARTSGFNGSNVIEAIDTPPQMGGAMVIMRGPGQAPPGVTLTPEQQETMKKQALLANKQEFARLALGMFASAYDGYALTFSYAGQAEAPEGKADVIDVKGEGDFAAKLFLDAKTHMPLMLSWMAKEPLVLNLGNRGQVQGGSGPGAAMAAGMAAAGGGGVQQTFTRQGAGPMTPEEREQMQKDAAEMLKQAQDKLRTVEYRLYYSDYRSVDGVSVPFTIQRSIDGKPSDELTFDKIKLNAKIDPKRFESK